jgi:DNA-binding GntR family transcriptional regulator
MAPPGRQPVTLPGQIAERIFAASASGEFAPGERISEDRLAATLEVGRGPVREALRILERCSVVCIESTRSRGTLVSAPQAGNFDAAAAAIDELIDASNTEAVRQLRAASQTDPRPAAGLTFAPT